MAESEIYTIFCIVVGEDVSFPVEIEKSKTVGQLKDDIKKKNSRLADFNALDLILYRVDLPDDDNLEHNVKETLRGRLDPLKPSKKWVAIYPDGLQEDTVHILVQPLRSSKSTGRLSRL